MQYTQDDTIKWLTANGITLRQLMEYPISYLQAQKTAHHLLKHHQALLTANEVTLLTTFNFQIRHRNLMKKITIKQIYTILNLGTKINRQLFKQQKALHQR